jgi:hypothetical protein
VAEATSPLVKESSRWEPLWLIEIWIEHREVFKSLVAGLLVCAFLDGGLELFHFWTAMSTAEEVKALTKVHYYGSVFVLALFGLGAAIDIIKLYWAKLRVGWREEQ